MSEDTPNGQPLVAPGSDGPSDVDASAQSLDDMRGQLRMENVAALRAKIGEEDFIDLVEYAEGQLVNKFSEADNRQYKDIDGVMSVFGSRRDSHQKLKELEQKNLEGQTGPDSGTDAGKVESKSDEKPTDASQAGEIPNGVVTMEVFNTLAAKSIAKESPEFVYVAELVAEVAKASNSSIEDVWEGTGQFEAYGFKAQASFLGSQAQQQHSLKQRNKVMPSSGNGIGSQRRVMNQDDLMKNVDSMTGDEITKSVEGGLVR